MPILHPSPQILEAFAFGKLTDTVASDTVVQHLETCVDCREKVTGMSGDSFLERMRAARLPGPENKKKEQPRSTDKFADLPPELRDNQQYEVLRELGRGGMGVVYLAKNRLMDRLEVLKVLSTSMLSRSSALDRFLREIRAAAALSHDNVVKAYSAMQFGDVLVFAMEYVEGDDLAKVVKAQGPLAVANACYYARQVALGLQHAHERGMVHRDIKPHNLILARIGKKHLVKILDFGLAKATSEKKVQTGLTQFGAMLGTPDYMAPEQSLDAATADIRADIYSLGCTLYYLLTGAPPFGAGSLLGLLQAHQTTTAKPLNLVRPEVPLALSAIVATMMAKEPGKRYQKPVEVAQALMPFFMKSTTYPLAAKRVSAPPAPETFTPVVSSSVQPPVADAPGSPRPTIPTVLMDGPEDANRFAFGTDRLVANPMSRKSRGQARGNPKAFYSFCVTLVTVAVLFFAGVYWGFGNLRVRTPEGTIVLENVPDGSEVVIDGKQWSVNTPQSKEPLLITVEAGTRKVQVRKGNVTFYSEDVAVDVGAKVPVRVRRDNGGAAPPIVAQPEFRSLFNGKDLTGWEPAGITQFLSWNVENGVLTLKSDNPNSGIREAVGISHKRTDFTDFHLRVEGQYFGSYSGRISVRQKDFGETYEFYLRGEGQTTYGPKNYGGLVIGSAPSGLAQQVDAQPANAKAGEWFTCEIIARQNSFSSIINDISVLNYQDLTQRSNKGGIGFLLPPGATLRIRKIEIKEFHASSAPPQVGSTPKRSEGGVEPNLKTLEMRGHTKFVWDVAFSEDGARLVSASEDCTLKLWNALTGEFIRDLGKENARFRGVAWSPDGRFIAAVGDFINVNVWDGKTFEMLYSLRGHTRGSYTVAISDDGRYMATASADNTVMVWDLPTGRPMHTLHGHTNIVQGVAFSHSGTKLASASWDRTVKVWDIATEKVDHVFRGHRGDVLGVAFDHADARLVSSGNDGTVRIWNLTDGSEERILRGSFPMRRVWRVTFTPDGRTLACAADAALNCWDPATGALLNGPPGEFGALFSLALSRDGRRVALADNSRGPTVIIRPFAVKN